MLEALPANIVAEIVDQVLMAYRPRGIIDLRNKSIFNIFRLSSDLRQLAV